MPEISFDLNLGSLFSPLVVIALAYFVNQARKAVNSHTDQRHDVVEAMVESRHAETTRHLEKIEAYQLETNGRVNKLEDLTGKDHDLLMQTVGKVEAFQVRQ